MSIFPKAIDRDPSAANPNYFGLSKSEIIDPLMVEIDTLFFCVTVRFECHGTAEGEFCIGDITVASDEGGCLKFSYAAPAGRKPGTLRDAVMRGIEERWKDINEKLCDWAAEELHEKEV